MLREGFYSCKGMIEICAQDANGKLRGRGSRRAAARDSVAHRTHGTYATYGSYKTIATEPRTAARHKASPCRNSHAPVVRSRSRHMLLQRQLCWLFCPRCKL